MRHTQYKNWLSSWGTYQSGCLLGYSVSVEWGDDKGRLHRRQIPVPKYDAKTLADFNVHFLRGDDIKVFALRMTLGHPDYSLKGQEAELTPGVPLNAPIKSVSTSSAQDEKQSGGHHA